MNANPSVPHLDQNGAKGFHKKLRELVALSLWLVDWSLCADVINLVRSLNFKIQNRALDLSSLENLTES